MSLEDYRAIWKPWTTALTAGPIDSGHHVAEEAPEELAGRILAALSLAVRRIAAMGLLTFSLNVTLDGCCDHREGIADEELHDFFTALLDESEAMLFGRVTYELMESAWPAVARDDTAPRALREWAVKLEAKPKYVVSASRSDFPWANTVRVEGDLRETITQLKENSPGGVLVGSPKLSAALEQLDLIDEYRVVVHPVLAGHGPTLFHGLERSRRLELVSTKALGSGAIAVHYRRRAE